MGKGHEPLLHLWVELDHCALISCVYETHIQQPLPHSELLSQNVQQQCPQQLQQHPQSWSVDVTVGKQLYASLQLAILQRDRQFATARSETLQPVLFVMDCARERSSLLDPVRERRNESQNGRMRGGGEMEMVLLLLRKPAFFGSVTQADQQLALAAERFLACISQHRALELGIDAVIQPAFRRRDTNEKKRSIKKNIINPLSLVTMLTLLTLALSTSVAPPTAIGTFCTHENDFLDGKIYGLFDVQSTT